MLVKVPLRIFRKKHSRRVARIGTMINMKEIDISELAGVWFHDITVNRIDIDYSKRKVVFECIIPVGFWNSPNRYGLTDGEIKCTLNISGLIYLLMEPPDKNSKYENTGVIEIIGEGSVTQDKFEVQLSRMPQNLPEDAFLHYFYVCEWNSFIFIAATGISFQIV